MKSQEEAINGLNYKDAGVDIDAGEALVEAIKPLAKSTRRDGVASNLGGFGAMFDLKAAGYTDPVLVAGTDGVGTKLKVAIESGIHHTVGIDLVAMCVNDLIVQGAEPLFFLDYYAMAKLDVAAGTAVVAGIAEGCRQAGCALIGGETAEMPGMYASGDYDLAGFCVGAVERDAIVTGEHVHAGDIILGLASSGLHSNGFSLVRKVIERTGLDYTAPAPFASDKTLGEALLEPTGFMSKAALPPSPAEAFGRSPISPAAACWKTFPVSCRKIWAPTSTLAPGHCPGSFHGWRQQAESPRTRWPGPSIAVSAWPSWSPRTASKRLLKALKNPVKMLLLLAK